MGTVSAGLLMCRWYKNEQQYFLLHPGGPFFKNKDDGCWTIPKGLAEDGEDLLQTATREFIEETGIVPEPPFLDLGEIKQKGGKVVYAWGFAFPPQYLDWQPEKDLKSNTFTMEWPPRSGRTQEFPEIDQARWFNFQVACKKINQAQIPFLEKARRNMQIKG